jgi:phosphocarrier protein
MPETQREKKKVYEKRFIIRNKLGLHARPAALFVQTANRFECDIEVCKGKQKVNGKSIMGIMTLAVGAGTAITVRTDGMDAAKAMSEISKLITSNFGE